MEMREVVTVRFLDIDTCNDLTTKEMTIAEFKVMHLVDRIEFDLKTYRIYDSSFDIDSYAVAVYLQNENSKDGESNG